MTDIDAAADHASRKRLWVCIAILAFFVAFALCALFWPYGAAATLRLLKARFDVYIMYGSTVGKVFWNFGIVLISFLLINAFARSRFFKPGIPLIALGIILLCSILLWKFDFDMIANVRSTYDVTPEDGDHFELCENGAYYHEYINLQHTHTLKALAHKVLFPNQNYITGEGFARLYDVPVFYPLILILVSIAAYLYTLRRIGRLNVGMSLLYVWGFYIVLFSYFDGGLLTGMGGIALMGIPFLPKLEQQKRWKSVSWILGGTIFFALIHLAGIVFLYGLYGMRDLSPAEYSLANEINYFVWSLALGRYAIVLLIGGAMWLKKERIVAILMLCIGAALYLHLWNKWELNARWSLVQPKDVPVAVALYTDHPVNIGTPLITASNYKLILYTPERDIVTWDLCQNLLRQAEGLSYKSLAVSVYCQVLRIPPANFSGGTQLKILEEGQCGMQCSPLLSSLFPVSQKENRPRIKTMDDQLREHGIGLCLTNATKVVSKPFYW